MKRSEMVLSGAEQLFASESALEVALAETAQLASTLTRMRHNSNMSMTVGQDAMNELSATISLLTEARGRLINTHLELDKVKTKMGCATVAAGFWDKHVEHEEPARSEVREVA